MAERMMYQPTEKQLAQWANYSDQVEMPSDDWFRAEWARTHKGKTAGWGLAKRDWVTGGATRTRPYQMGLWQGRVDAARGLEYSEERNQNSYNLGYYRGYTEYQSNRRGWDAGTRARFDAQYTADLEG